MKDALELEDYDEEGAIPASAIRESFVNLEIDIDDELMDFVFYVIYQKSESIDKLRYSVLFEMLDGKLPGLNATSSEGGRKRPESSSPEKLKARNKEKFSGAQIMAESNETPAQKKDYKNSAKAKANVAADDDYEEEFEKLLDKDDEEGDEEVTGDRKGAQGIQFHQDSEDAEPGQQKDEEEDDEKKDEENEDDYIDEEEMLDIAERCFVKIADAILEAGVSVR